MIDLSEYVGHEVIYTMDGEDLPLHGFVSENLSCKVAPYCITSGDRLRNFSKEGRGWRLITSIRIKDPIIDLSKYVGRKVILTLDNEETLSGEVQFLKNDPYTYCYVVSGWQFTKTGKGMSKPQIKSIQLKNPMTGISQQHPNINLEDFEGQRCYVKWSDGRGSIGTILRRVSSSGSSSWDVVGKSALYSKNGTTSYSSIYVTEIYGEGAFDVTTKDTFDTPSTDAVKNATEALKDLSEEQIARVLHALKGK
jgi:hypothetical protein